LQQRFWHSIRYKGISMRGYLPRSTGMCDWKEPCAMKEIASWIIIAFASLFFIIGPITHLLTGKFLFFFD
jgi:hypothetical protein